MHPGSGGGELGAAEGFFFEARDGASGLMVVVVERGRGRGVLVVVQSEHETRRSVGSRTRTRVQLPSPGCGHRVQVHRTSRQRQRRPRGSRRITALGTLVGPRLARQRRPPRTRITRRLQRATNAESSQSPRARNPSSGRTLHRAQHHVIKFYIETRRLDLATAQAGDVARDALTDVSGETIVATRSPNDRINATGTRR